MPPATKVWQAPNNINSLILAVLKLKNAITWQDWKFSICMVFRAGVHDVTVVKKIPNEDEKDGDWDAKVQESLTIIGLTIDLSNYVHICSATNRAETWITLAGVYEKNPALPASHSNVSSIITSITRMLQCKINN